MHRRDSSSRAWAHGSSGRSRPARSPESHWVAVADYLIDTLADGLLALSKGPNAIKNFHVVNTRGLLKRAQLGHPGDSNDWQNEIHPNDRGYKKIAKKVEPILESLIGTV